VATEALGIGELARSGRPEQVTIRSGRDPPQGQPQHHPSVGTQVLNDVGERADRCAAAGLQGSQQRPLGSDCGAHLSVVEDSGQRACGVQVVHPALAGQRTLPGRRQHLLRVEQLGGVSNPAEPGQPSGCDHHPVQLPVDDAADPRVDVAADRHYLQPRVQRAQLCGTPWRAGAEHRPGGNSPSTIPSRATSASRGSARSGTAARTNRGSAAVGRSL
jgi:hypothetical protein